MSELQILVWSINESYDEMEKMASPLLETASLFGATLQLFGVGHKFIEHKQRLKILHAHLKMTEASTIVICMDGADTLFNDHVEILKRKFIDKQTTILISAEKAFSYQYEEFKDHFDAIDSEYRYLNAGTFMGYAGALLKMLEEIFDLDKKYPSANDQGLLGIWAYQNVHDTRTVQLDTNCDIFWVTTYDWDILYDVAHNEKIILNPNTNTKPSIIHNVGNNDINNRKAYTSAIDKILTNKTDHHHRVFILTPLVNDADYNLWARVESEIDEREPIFFQKKHPYASMHFYGVSEKKDSDSFIATHYVEEAISILKSRYFVDFVVHVPKGYYFDVDQIYDYINAFNFRDITIGSEYPKSDSFIFYQKKFYPFQELLNVKSHTSPEVLEISKRRLALSTCRPLSRFIQQKPSFPFDVLSIGGWCGPAIALNNMNLRQESGPFCMIHSTTECLIQIANGEYLDFFSDGESTIMPHHDLNDSDVVIKIQSRLTNFTERLKDPKPILFIRTIISPDYERSFIMMVEYMKLLENQYGRKDKLLLLLHDQGVGTTKIKMLTPRTMIWAAEGKVGWHVPNRKRIFQNYAKIIEYCLEDKNWESDIPHIKSQKILNHHSPELKKYLYDK